MTEPAFKIRRNGETVNFDTFLAISDPKHHPVTAFYTTMAQKGFSEAYLLLVDKRDRMKDSDVARAVNRNVMQRLNNYLAQEELIRQKRIQARTYFVSTLKAIADSKTS